MSTAANKVVRGPQTSLLTECTKCGRPMGEHDGTKCPPRTPAQRARDYRKNRKQKQGALEVRAGFANLQQPGALPVQTTSPDDKGDPARWSSVPEVAPAPANENNEPVTNPDGTPRVTAPGGGADPSKPQPVVTKPGGKKQPSEQEQASADKLGEKLARFWDAGGECARIIFEENVKDNAQAPALLRVWMGVMVKEWKDKETRAMVKAAGSQLAIDWGIATVASPPPAVVVLGAVAISGAAHLAAYALDKEKQKATGGRGGAPAIDAQATEQSEQGARRDDDVAGAMPIDDDESPSDQPYAQSWSQFGKIPKGASS